MGFVCVRRWFAFDINFLKFLPITIRGSQKMLYYCGDNCSIVTVNGHEWSTCNKIKACVAAGSPAAGPRPQDRKPSRLTKSLSEIMFESGDDVCATRLSDDAQHLLNALERRDEQQTENVTYATPLDIFTKCQ